MFLRDFFQLFFPDVERRLDFGNVEFLDKEVFTDFPEGSSRRADVVAKLATHDGKPELVLIHVEVQASHNKEFPARMFEYYALLGARYNIPVFPIVVYLYGGREGLTTEEYRIHLFEDEILRFRYRCVELARLDVEEYRRGVGPVGAALGALMDSSRTPERAELRVSLLLQVIESGLDEARQLLLGNLVENYLELSAEEWERYRRLVARKEYRKVQDVELTWMDKLLRQGEEKGREQGREEGLQSGLMEGKRQTLLTLMHEKFGPLPETLKERVGALESLVELDVYLKRILTASSLEELGLEE